MTLVELIKALKEELKHGAGDRELRPDVTVATILAPAAPEPVKPSREKGRYGPGTAGASQPMTSENP